MIESPVAAEYGRDACTWEPPRQRGPTISPSYRQVKIRTSHRLLRSGAGDKYLAGLARVMRRLFTFEGFAMRGYSH
jgi:hypothetical protein